MTAAIALLTRYWHFAVIAALVALLGVQTVRLADSDAELSDTLRAASDLRAQRESAAREHRDKIGALERQHASEQQTLEESYVERIKALEDRRRTDTAELGRMRNAIQQYAAADSLRGGEVDATAIQRAADRLEALAALVGEGAELLQEGRSLVELRDEEVARALGQIRIDRAACKP